MYLKRLKGKGSNGTASLSEFLHPAMSQTHELEQLYIERVRVDKDLENEYRGLLKHVVDLMISKMKAMSPVFEELYRETYYGGSFFDGLKVNSTKQEFDLNIVFKRIPMEVTGLGEDPAKKNFCFLRVTKPTLSPEEEKIVDKSWWAGTTTLSPAKMFQLLQSSIDRALTDLDNEMLYQGRRYRVTREVHAPVTLVIVAEDGSKSCEIDFVPSFKLDLENLVNGTRADSNNSKLHQQVSQLNERFGVNYSPRNFMAIALHRADTEKFELDFHDVERQVLYNRGCVKKVIKLMKYLRDIKGGSMAKLWSHLLKVSRQKEFNNNEIHSISRLL